MAVNKVVYDGQILIDLTNDTVTSDCLVSGRTAHGKDGKSVSGNLFEGIPSSVCLDEAIFDSQGNPILDSSSQAIDGRIIYDSGNTNRIFGNGHVGWDSICESSISSVIIHGEGRQGRLNGTNKLKLIGRTKAIANGNPQTKRICDGNTLFLGLSPNNYGNGGKVYSYEVTDNMISVASRGDSGYGIGFDFRVNPGDQLFRTSHISNQDGLMFMTQDGSLISWGYFNLDDSIIVPENAYWCIATFIGPGHETLQTWKNPAITVNEKSSYEPYCGGIPAPNPQYPIKPMFLEEASVTDGMNAAPLPILRALPDGSVRDEIDVVSGTVVRRIWEVVLNGSDSETWRFSYGSGQADWAYITENKTKVSHDSKMILTDKFYFLDYSLDWSNKSYFVSFESDRIRFDYPPIKDLSEWIMYIRSNPIKVWYPLETPIIEHYDPAILYQHPGYTQLILQNSELSAQIDADVYRAQIIRM